MNGSETSRPPDLIKIARSHPRYKSRDFFKFVRANHLAKSGTWVSEGESGQIFLESFFKVDLAKRLKPDFRTLKIKGCLKFMGLGA